MRNGEMIRVEELMNQDKALGPNQNPRSSRASELLGNELQNQMVE